MADKSWTFELAELKPPDEDTYVSPRRTTHTVNLHHSYWTTKRTISLDGILLPPDQIRSYSIFGILSDDLFMVDGHACMVHIRSTGFTYKYDFLVDGISVQTGQPVAVAPQVFQAQPGGKDKMPGWTWLFILLTIVVGLAGIFAGAWLASLVVGTPSKNAPFLPIIVITAIVLQAQMAIVSASKEPRKDDRDRIIRCAIIIVRTGLIITAFVAVAFILIR